VEVCEYAARNLPESAAVAQPLQRRPSATEQILLPADPTLKPSGEFTEALHLCLVFEGLSQADLLAICHDASLG